MGLTPKQVRFTKRILTAMIATTIGLAALTAMYCPHIAGPVGLSGIGVCWLYNMYLNLRYYRAKPEDRDPGRKVTSWIVAGVLLLFGAALFVGGIVAAIVVSRQ